MIRYQEMVPDYYPEKSRDFQVLCRLYDFALNGLKYNIDSMQFITDTMRAKDTILPLIGGKVGIYDKKSYTNRNLLEALPIAVKYKGSLKAVTILINAFLDSMEQFDYATAYYSKDEDSAFEISEMLNRKVNKNTIVIVLSTYPSMTDLHVLDEFLKMVIPTGMLVEYMFGYNKVIFEKFRYCEHVFLFYTNEENVDNTMYKQVSYVKNRDLHYESELLDGETILDEERNENNFINKVMSNIDVNSVSLATVSEAPQSGGEE